MQKNFGVTKMYEIFRELCEERNVKPGKVALDCGITPSTFTRWKQGAYKPKADKLQKIADYFGVPLEYLVTGKKEDSQTFHNDVLVSLNDDLNIIIEIMSGWNPKYIERMRKKVEEMDGIIGGEE